MSVTNKTQVIDLSAQAVEFTWPLTLTELKGRDISSDVILLSLGSDQAPASWLPARNTSGSHPIDTREVQLLIPTDITPQAGDYWLWSQITDAPEVVPRKHFRIRIL